jgi:very-short-patch-repair endonuclease
VTERLVRKNPPRNGEGDRSSRTRSGASGGGGPRVLRTPIKQVKRARRLRRQMSLPEVLLWQVLRTRPEGLKFRRQFPTDRATVDFACLQRRLVIEVDGECHSFGVQPWRDARRDARLRHDGFRVLRIPARDVLRDMDAVLRWIIATCSEAGPDLPPRHPGAAGRARSAAADAGGPSTTLRAVPLPVPGRICHEQAVLRG